MDASSSGPLTVSAIVLTHNRATRCLDSVWHNALAMQGLAAEILVINNGTEPVPLPASIGGIACRVIPMKENLGAVARNEGLRRARGEFILALDDDSYIDPGLAEAMVAEFARDRSIGGVAFRIQNGDEEEACLLPTVFHGCACGFRRSALEEAGGYPAGYLYYGEEYDLAFRLYQLGYRFVICNHARRVRHVRDRAGRSNDRILKLLVRNNAYLWFSFLPAPHILPALKDTLQRYRLVARKEQAERGFLRGLAALPLAALRALARRDVLTDDVFRRLFMIDAIEALCRSAVRYGYRRAILCGVGKFPSLWTGILRRNGLEPLAFWDHNPCWIDQTVDGIPVRLAGSSLPDAPPDCAWLVGTTSLAENSRWRERLEIEMGIYVLDTARSAAAAEDPARSGAVDLVDACEMCLYSRDCVTEQPFRARGMRPASILTNAETAAGPGRENERLRARGHR